MTTNTRLRVAMAVGCAAGLAIAGYLTWTQYAGAEPLCLASGACERVQTSRYAELGGMPVALLGVAGYAAILATLAIPARAAWCCLRSWRSSASDSAPISLI
jgi:uncharacterized membrane protein